MASEVRFQILGPVGVSIADAEIPMRAPRQRALLAMLLTDANRAVHPSALIEGIWGASPPQHPEAALQIVVSRLRNALGPLAERLLSDRAGYRIVVQPDELDLERAQRSFDLARARFIKDDNVGAAEAASVGLSCWSGTGFADLRNVPFYETANDELRALHWSLYELRNRAFLRCSRHVEVLADIDGWIRAEPWRERTRAHQMIALYRAGRRVDAFAAYEELRRYLGEELNIEPSAYMQELYRRLSDQDPSLLARRAGTGTRLPPWTSFDLPFVGRTRVELRIFEHLREVAAGATRMVLIAGEAGIGKSRLVLEVARRADDEAIILVVDGADALQPGLRSIAAALAESASTTSDAELECCLGQWPGDVAELAPAIRRRLPDLPAAIQSDDIEVRATRSRDALASWMAGVSQRAPIILIVDDAHRAGPALLFLLGALLTAPEPMRVLVLATARCGATEFSSRLEQLARRVGRDGCLDRIALNGLSLASVQRLLTEVGMSDTAFDAEELAALTQGHPDRLGEQLHARAATR